ncbi:MAG: glycoside hydrolase 43 family protein, partial [Terracidiphilus sp.]
MIEMIEWKPWKWLRMLPVLICLTAVLAPVRSQAPTKVVEAAYHNPILFADYSDPDVIRDGANYYLVASTFHFVPGIPILQSTDLVHWTIVGHVVQRMTMDPRYSMIGGNRYGKGVWAPAIRKHNGLFYVYFPTPTEGIFVSTATKITGPWSAPIAVMGQAGLEDPCPFWDDDGSAYLIHSKTGAGPLILHRMSADGKRVLDEGKVIVEDPVHLPVLEGPKLYKRNGYYYIFAPFGGVGSGAQAVLRS